ncbi:MAG: glycoside hydrolase family 25 protein [Eubacterium sp.]|nr:glycoside hydrolase family 25 protein [Eubacterium sp.]
MKRNILYKLTAVLVAAGLTFSPAVAMADTITSSSGTQEESVQEVVSSSEPDKVQNIDAASTAESQDSTVTGPEQTDLVGTENASDSQNTSVQADEESKAEDAVRDHSEVAEDTEELQKSEDKEKEEDTEDAAEPENTEDSLDSGDSSSEDQTVTPEEVGALIKDVIEQTAAKDTDDLSEVSDMQDQVTEAQEAYDSLAPEEQDLLSDSKEALDNADQSLDDYRETLEEVKATGTVTIDPEAPANSFRYINGQLVEQALDDVEEETAQAQAVADGMDIDLVKKYNIRANTVRTADLSAKPDPDADEIRTRADVTTADEAADETASDETAIELVPSRATLLSAASGIRHFGIDVSQWQGNVNWNQVKASGVEFAIIRCGDGSDYNDRKFSHYVSECERLGIPYGVYLYARATSVAAAQREAAHALAMIGSHKPQLPVYYDIEENAIRLLGDGAVSMIATTFCNFMAVNGFDSGVYSSTSWWQGSGAVLTNFAKNDRYYHWIAQWNDTNTYRGRYESWQFAVGSAGTVPGIPGDIDMDYWYGELKTDKLENMPLTPSESADAASLANAPAGSVPMYRLFNPFTTEHFYTANIRERNQLVALGWNYEEVGWYAPEQSDTPVYRLCNPYSADHHYTTNIKERDMLVKLGWNYEGIGWYSDDSKGVPLYRQFNPYVKIGSHNYTANKKENDYLTTIGWNAEGIGWYGVKG